MKRRAGENASPLHVALQQKAEAAKADIEMCASVHAQADADMHVSTVMVFAALDASEVHQFVAELGLDELSPQIDTVIGAAPKHVVVEVLRRWKCDDGLEQWLLAPLPPGFAALIAVASNGAGDLVLCHTDVPIRPDAYEMTIMPVTGSA